MNKEFYCIFTHNNDNTLCYIKGNLKSYEEAVEYCESIYAKYNKPFFILKSYAKFETEKPPFKVTIFS